MTDKTYQPLTIPRLTWNKETLRPTFAEIVAQPLEPGFGITLVMPYDAYYLVVLKALQLLQLLLMV